MNPLIARLQDQALRTSFVAESVASSVPEGLRSQWIRSKASSHGDDANNHTRLAGANFKLAAVGLIGATGIALAGGPSSLGVAAFVASAASTGGAIFHLAAGKLSELRGSLQAHESHARPLTDTEREDLVAHARQLTLSVWDESMSELRETLLQKPVIESAPASKPSPR
jgi:hypothetical protein